MTVPKSTEGMTLYELAKDKLTSRLEPAISWLEDDENWVRASLATASGLALTAAGLEVAAHLYKTDGLDPLKTALGRRGLHLASAGALMGSGVALISAAYVDGKIDGWVEGRTDSSRIAQESTTLAD